MCNIKLENFYAFCTYRRILRMFCTQQVNVCKQRFQDFSRLFMIKFNTKMSKTTTKLAWNSSKRIINGTVLFMFLTLDSVGKISSVFSDYCSVFSVQ